MKYVIGIDLGTSSLKIIIVNKNGEIVASKSEEYNIISLQQKYSEQDPEVWVKAFEVAMSKLTAEYPNVVNKVEGLSIAGQMHSLVLLDKSGKPLRNAILWNDVRNSEECNFINENYKKEILKITKNIALEGFTLPKILWVQKNEPEIFEKTAMFMLPKDYS